MADQKKTAIGNHEVGYCRPPKQTQFRKGRSGNPRGRRRKELRPITDRQLRADMLMAMEREVMMTLDGKPQKTPAIVAIYHRILAEALKGNYRAMKLAVDLRQALVHEHVKAQVEHVELVLKYDKWLAATGERGSAMEQQAIAECRRRALDTTTLD